MLLDMHDEERTCPQRESHIEIRATSLCMAMMSQNTNISGKNCVILFNRRREGEVSKLSLTAFTLRDTSLTHPDVELALTDLETKLYKHFQRIEIKGKRGRKVPVLLTPDMVTSMELLVKTRNN
ncbi:uncharacterized protein LOC113662066 isoform X1 [Tachysurus ichikawai]